MSHLSVNVNKIATLRNSRGGKIPSVLGISEIVLDAGAYGITVHPREDERHITKQDVFELKEFILSYNKSNQVHKEFNIEGEPSDRFLELVLKAKPDQATLVPVKPGEITSDHGFDLKIENTKSKLRQIVQTLQKEKIRVSLFMETDVSQYPLVKEVGAERIELYTGPFAHAYDHSEQAGKDIFKEFVKAAEAANALGLGINAGHDLDTENLKLFSKLPYLLEVSIGHRLVSEALVIGMEATVKKYIKLLQ